MILHSIEQGAGPPLVLLHGLFGTGKNLGALARGLGRQARVVSLDMRNHGESPHDPDMAYPAMAADVAQTMDAHGIACAPVIGHSMGGKVAMMLACLHPRRVDRLAVLDIAPITYDHDYDSYVAAMRAIPLAPGLTRHAADDALTARIADAALRAFLLSNLVLGQNPHWRFGLDEIGGAIGSLQGWTDPPGARPYAGPALFLRGGGSDYVMPHSHGRIAALFPAARIQTIDHAAHWIHAQQPQAVVAALQDFLA